MGLADEADRERASRSASEQAHEERELADRVRVCTLIDELAAEFAEAAPSRLGNGPWHVGVKFSSEGWKTWVSTSGVMVFPDESWEFIRPGHNKHEKGVWDKAFWNLDADQCRAKFVAALAGKTQHPQNTWQSFREGGPQGERSVTERGTLTPPDPPPRRSIFRRRRD